MANKTENFYIKILASWSFISPACGDYLTARWCYLNGLYFQFYWNAAQSIEKFLKAFLILHKRNVRGYGHDLRELFIASKEICGNLAPENLQRPEDVLDNYFKTEMTETFINRINSLGDPNNRYNMHGILIKGDDLFKLDFLILDFAKAVHGKKTGCNDYEFMKFIFPTAPSMENSELEKTLYTSNIALRHPDYKWQKVNNWKSWGIRNSGMNDLLFAEKPIDNDRKEALKYIRDKVYISKELKETIKKLNIN
jgi:HEPN domain-containing protein